MDCTWAVGIRFSLDGTHWLLLKFLCTVIIAIYCTVIIAISCTCTVIIAICFTVIIAIYSPRKLFLSLSVVSLLSAGLVCYTTVSSVKYHQKPVVVNLSGTDQGWALRSFPFSTLHSFPF